MPGQNSMLSRLLLTTAVHATASNLSLGFTDLQLFRACDNFNLTHMLAVPEQRVHV